MSLDAGNHTYSVTKLLWLPASVGPRDMGMVPQHKLPEVT